MTLRTLTAFCVAVASLSATATAVAATQPVTAKLQQPLAAPTKFIAGGAVFVCEADTCVATVPTSQTFATSACKVVASKVGPIIRFEGRKALDADRLAQCNAGAAQATALARQ